ncbi:hypothetical protein GTP58_21075 [Duganella sp. CY15W]|uniref:hypothetical protein n=1 Tax=Duganella sp. CY15W TaxID=2692172 RepID=UPI00136D1C77|nr:hypothetical protein [Duganella sp. CY15W]MYM30832.1 hypothetical protein [Duganella sp. CY15W]
MNGSDVPVLMAGVSMAMVFQIFALAGIGQIFYCGGQSALICRRAVFHLLFAVLAGVSSAPWMQLACAAAALLLGAGGLLSKALLPQRPCNCFGVLSYHLEPWVPAIRLGLLGFGGLACATLAGLDRTQLDGAAYQQAACWTLKLGLLAQAFWLIRVMVARDALAQAALAAAPKEVALADTVLAGYAEGQRALDVGAMLSAVPAVAVLMVSPACESCAQVTRQVAALAAAGRLPLPLYLHSSAPYAGKDGALLLSDPRGVFGAALGISATPLLAVLSREPASVVARLALGEDEIRRVLLDLMV